MDAPQYSILLAALATIPDGTRLKFSDVTLNTGCRPRVQLLYLPLMAEASNEFDA